MGVGLMRSLQSHQTFFGLYNFVVNTSKRVLFLPPSDAYVRSFLYIFGSLGLSDAIWFSLAGRDWGQEEKGTTEDEMAGWHH